MWSADRAVHTCPARFPKRSLDGVRVHPTPLSHRMLSSMDYSMRVPELQQPVVRQAVAVPFSAWCTQAVEAYVESKAGMWPGYIAPAGWPRRAEGLMWPRGAPSVLQPRSHPSSRSLRENKPAEASNPLLLSTKVEAGEQWLARAGHNGRALGPAPLQHPFPCGPGYLPPPPPGKPPPARAPAPAPPAQKATTNPYVAFCREQRPFLPTDLRNAEREQTLGMRIDCVDMESHRVPQPRFPVVRRTRTGLRTVPIACHCTSTVRVMGITGVARKPTSPRLFLPSIKSYSLPNTCDHQAVEGALQGREVSV